MSPRRRGARLLGATFLLVALGAMAVVGCGGDDPPRRHTIGFLRSVEASGDEPAFRHELDDRGLRLRVLGGRPDEVHPDPDDARSTVRTWLDDGAELIVALSTGSVVAATEITDRVPVVFVTNDPVGAGLVREPRHPEGNATGVSYRVPADRTLLITKQALGDLQRIGCLYAGLDPGSRPPLQDLQRAARTLDVELRCASFADPSGVAAAVQEVAGTGVDAIVLIGSPTSVRAAPELEAAAAAIDVPVISNSDASFALLTLRPDGKTVYRQLAAQVDRLLDGADVADVPVEDPGHYLLVVNLSVARRLDRVLPRELIGRADQVVR